MKLITTAALIVLITSLCIGYVIYKEHQQQIMPPIIPPTNPPHLPAPLLIPRVLIYLIGKLTDLLATLTPKQISVRQTAFAYQEAMVQYTISKLNIIDIIEKEGRPLSCLEIKTYIEKDNANLNVRVDEKQICRVLTAAAYQGLLDLAIAQAERPVFKVGLKGVFLSASNPMTNKHIVEHLGNPDLMLAEVNLYKQIMTNTGKTAFENEHQGMKVWEYLQTHPAAQRTFNLAMEQLTYETAHELLFEYDFSSFSTICDIGGSYGQLSQTIIQAYPHMHAINYDLPAVIQEAEAIRKQALKQTPNSFANRLKHVAGNFFETYPADLKSNCDAYLLKNVVHDWSVKENVQILSRIKQAMKPGAKVILFESILNASEDFYLEKMKRGMDLHMMTLVDGQQYTVQEIDYLFLQSGLERTHFQNMKFGPYSIVEAKLKI